MIQEFEHNYAGYNGIPSRCNVKIWTDDGEYFILFENIGKGTSVTNMSEKLSTEIVEKFSFDPDNCKFYETYQEYDYDTIDEIKYTWIYEKDKWIASNPEWTPANDLVSIFFG